MEDFEGFRLIHGLTFDVALQWLEDHVGTLVRATVGSKPDTNGNTFGSMVGVLRRGDGELSLVNTRGGRALTYGIGDSGHLQLLEGDFESADRAEDEELTALLLSFREVQINVWVEVAGDGGPMITVR